MAAPDQKRTPPAPKRRSASPGRRERRTETTLEVGPDFFTDDGIRGLLEDWLIPMIVEDMIQDRMEKQCDFPRTS